MTRRYQDKQFAPTGRFAARLGRWMSVTSLILCPFFALTACAGYLLGREGWQYFLASSVISLVIARGANPARVLVKMARYPELPDSDSDVMKLLRQVRKCHLTIGNLQANYLAE